jgi:hypothetical protein
VLFRQQTHRQFENRFVVREMATDGLVFVTFSIFFVVIQELKKNGFFFFLINGSMNGANIVGILSGRNGFHIKETEGGVIPGSLCISTEKATIPIGINTS